MIVLSDPSAVCSAPVLGKVLGLTDRHVRELTRDGVLRCARTKLKGMRFRLDENVQRYQQHQRKVQEQAKGNGEYERERTRRMRALATKEELGVSLLRGELHKSEDVLFVLTQRITSARSHLLAIPSRLASRLVGEIDQRNIYDLLQTEIELALRGVSQLRQVDFERASNASRLKAAQADAEDNDSAD